MKPWQTFDCADPLKLCATRGGGTTLPNVLIIGDSVSDGYTSYVRSGLNTTANVGHGPDNSGGGCADGVLYASEISPSPPHARAISVFRQLPHAENNGGKWASLLVSVCVGPAIPKLRAFCRLAIKLTNCAGRRVRTPPAHPALVLHCVVPYRAAGTGRSAPSISCGHRCACTKKPTVHTQPFANASQRGFAFLVDCCRTRLCA